LFSFGKRLEWHPPKLASPAKYWTATEYKPPPTDSPFREQRRERTYPAFSKKPGHSGRQN
jgi:hypothetical protein